MENKFLSLLYPSAEAALRAGDKSNLPNISEIVCDELGLTELFDLKTAELTEFFTLDEEVILYRHEMMKDILEVPEVLSTLGEVHPILDDITELRRLDNDTLTSADSYLYSITEIELYVSCIETMYRGIFAVRDRLTSTACRSLADFVGEIYASDYYTNLKAKLSAIGDNVSEIKSITVGVNLDRELRPESAAVISVNSESFKSGKMLDKILRLSFKNDSFTTIAELTPLLKGKSDNRRDALIGAFNGAIEEVFRSSVKGWRNTVADYVIDNTDFLLRLLPEMEFVARSAELIDKLRSGRGLGVCYPKLAPKSERSFSAQGLYNPRVALAIDGQVVKNDLAFDCNAGIYVLTGPNRGGKSVITVALGAAQAMFQLGLPVPADEVTLSVTDGIFTHFPEGALDTIDKGRLGEECARLREIFDATTKDSMILLDESLSSTGAYEASYIASEILAAFAAKGVRGIFSTHLHELAASIPEINARAGAENGVAVDTLVAGIDEGERSFKIHRMKPDGKSYAKDIADKYGLSFENLMKGK